MMGMISSLLVFQLGQARVWFSMSRDGLLPKLFGRVHPRFRTPATATWIAGFLVGVPAGFLDIGTLSDLSNIGTLFAFVLVSLGVIILRYRDPGRHRGFRAPGGIAAPVLSVLFCVLLMSGLPILTWLRFFAWLMIGLTIYCALQPAPQRVCWEELAVLPLESPRPSPFILSLPKAELHLHLEGTIDPPTLLELRKRHGKESTLAEVEQLYQYQDFAGFLMAFKAITEDLQTAGGLRTDHLSSDGKAQSGKCAACRGLCVSGCEPVAQAGFCGDF